MFVKSFWKTHSKCLSFGVWYKSSLSAEVLFLSPQMFVHLLHIDVGSTVSVATVNVKSVLDLAHDENADVTDRTQVHELLQLVLEESLVENLVNGYLEKDHHQVHRRTDGQTAYRMVRSVTLRIQAREIRKRVCQRQRFEANHLREKKRSFRLD